MVRLTLPRQDLRGSERPLTAAATLAAGRRRRLTDAMATVCAERGYRATTVADVVAAARTSRNTAYELFANKEGIFLALLERTMAELLDQIGAACEAPGPGRWGRLEAGLAAALHWVAANPLAARVWLVDSTASTGRGRAEHDRATRRFVELLGDCVPEEAERQGNLEELVVGGVISMLRFLVIAGEAERAPALLPELMQFVSGPFAPPSRFGRPGQG